MSTPLRIPPGYYPDSQGVVRWWTGQSWAPLPTEVKHTSALVIVLDVIGIMILVCVVLPFIGLGLLGLL